MVQKNVKFTRSVSLAHASPYTPPPNVFLLDPKNQRLLHGLPQFPLPINASLFFAASLIALIFISAMLLIHGVSGLTITSQLNSSKAIVQGEIVDRRRVSPGSMNQGLLHYVTYRFSTTEGGVYEEEQFVIKETYDRLSEGSLVNVKYIASDPVHSTLVGENSDHTLGVTDFLMTVLGVLGIFGSVIYLLPLLQQLYDTMHLQQRGSLVAGHVTHCHRYVAKSVSGFNPREIKAALSSTFFVEVQYSFHVAGGKELRGVAHHQRDDLAQVHLPGFGTPVAVLYLDEKRYTVL